MMVKYTKTKTKKEIVRQTVCINCGHLISDEIYGIWQCKKCKCDLSKEKTFYCCNNDDEHLCNKCYKLVSLETIKK